MDDVLRILELSQTKNEPNPSNTDDVLLSHEPQPNIKSNEDTASHSSQSGNFALDARPNRSQYVYSPFGGSLEPAGAGLLNETENTSKLSWSQESQQGDGEPSGPQKSQSAHTDRSAADRAVWGPNHDITSPISSILAAPNPDRPAMLQDLEADFVSLSLAQQMGRADYLFPTEDSKSNEGRQTNDSFILPPPTPLGSLRLLDSTTTPEDSGASSPKSPPKSPCLGASQIPIPRTPKSSRSPLLSSTNLTPITSNEEYVIYSDSDTASQSWIELKDKPPHRYKREDTPNTKARKKLRRKSNRSDTPSSFVGSGYTSIPATGKIFRNLLILEESLRQQVIQQRALRRKYLIFLAVLCSLIASISHHLYLTDAINTTRGTKRVILQFVLLALLVTLMLYHLSGEYQKTIVLPRKFLSSTNKGLRQLNVRLIKIVVPWTDSFTDLIREILLYIIAGTIELFHKINPSAIKNKKSRIEVFLISCQSQCQPRIGVTDVKLVLNARVFNTDVREGWELYRSEFWINEGVRRRQNMLSFINEDESKEKESKDGTRTKTIKKDKLERRERKKSNAARNTEILQPLPHSLATKMSIPE